MPPTSTASRAATPPATAKARQRPDIANRRLIAVSAVMAVALGLYFVVLPYLPGTLRKAGSPAVYLIGAAGALLLLVAVVFSLVKRTGRGGSPVGWFIAHVVCSNLGFVLVAIHTTGKLDRAPALLLLNLIAIMGIGIWARVVASRSMADTFGTKMKGFAVPDAATRAELKAVIEKKSAVLTRLDPAAREATFSVTLGHFLKSPAVALSYLKLERAEERLMGARDSVAPAQAWWRALHMALAAAFVIGLLIHVVLVTFFAGYVAGGQPIHWWHLTAWDF